MSDVKVGDKVGVILSIEGVVANFLGYGTYDGRIAEGSPLGIPNPRITMEDGTVVWGCQVWWGDEEKIKRVLAGKIINEVDLHGNLKSHG